MNGFMGKAISSHFIWCATLAALALGGLLYYSFSTRVMPLVKKEDVKVAAVPVLPDEEIPSQKNAMDTPDSPPGSLLEPRRHVPDRASLTTGTAAAASPVAASGDTDLPNSVAGAQNLTEKEGVIQLADRFSDTRIPLKQREANIRALARRGDREAVQILMAVADQNVYLNRAAVVALGKLNMPEVAQYLRSRLQEVQTHDVALLLQCIETTGLLLGREALGDIAAVLEAVRQRDDGHAVAIGVACVRALGDIAQPEAVQLLGKELAYVRTQPRVNLSYGAEIVQACAKIGDPDAADMLTGYADFLEQTKPTETEPRQYYEQKIQETRDVVQQLRR